MIRVFNGFGLRQQYAENKNWKQKRELVRNQMAQLGGYRD